MAIIPNGLFGVIARKNSSAPSVFAYHATVSQKPGGAVSASNHAFTGLTSGDMYAGIILTWGINTDSVVTDQADTVTTRSTELASATSGIYAWGFDFEASAASTTITLDSTTQTSGSRVLMLWRLANYTYVGRSTDSQTNANPSTAILNRTTTAGNTAIAAAIFDSRDGGTASAGGGLDTLDTDTYYNSRNHVGCSKESLAGGSPETLSVNYTDSYKNGCGLLMEYSPA